MVGYSQISDNKHKQYVKQRANITILSKSRMDVNNDPAPFPNQFTVGIYFLSLYLYMYLLTLFFSI